MLETSDKIVTEDLLRFYKPKGFTPIERNDYDYTKKVQDEKIPLPPKMNPARLPNNFLI